MGHFLPTTLAEAKKLGWDTLDIVLVSGDAYIDHPSFGTALIGRYLEAHGFKVGVIPQPRWTSTEDFMALGKPNLFFCVSAGNMDSMVNNYTADKKPRRTDMYSVNNEAGKRPDRASIVYSNKIREAYKDVRIVLGGVEASMRRFTHYDFWDDKARRPLILDAKADISLYGLSEKAILQLAEDFRRGVSWENLQQPPNSTMVQVSIENLKPRVMLPSVEDSLADKIKFAESFARYYHEGRKNIRTLSLSRSRKILGNDTSGQSQRQRARRTFLFTFSAWSTSAVQRTKNSGLGLCALFYDQSSRLFRRLCILRYFPASG